MELDLPVSLRFLSIESNVLSRKSDHSPGVMDMRVGLGLLP